MKTLGPGYVYVSGRTRAKGESNGKSGNLNNVFAQIYPTELEIPGNEVLCIFDADQVNLVACRTNTYCQAIFSTVRQQVALINARNVLF